MDSDKTVLNWILASYFSGGVIFTFVGIRMVPKAREAFDRIAFHGPFFIIGEVALSIILWLPLLIAGLWMGYRKDHRINRLATLKEKKQLIADSLDTLSGLTRQSDDIWAEKNALGSNATPLQLKGIHKRLSTVEHEMSLLLVTLLEGRCLDCEGNVTETAPGGAPGAVCGSCGHFYNVGDVGKVSSTLRSNPKSGWSLDPPLKV